LQGTVERVFCIRKQTPFINQQTHRAKEENMKKTMRYVLSLVMILSLLTGCGQVESSSTYFESCSAEISETFSTVKGTIHLEDNSGTFLYVDVGQDEETVVDYSLERDEGDIQVYYEAPDGTKTLLIDTSDSQEDLLEGSCTVSLQEGTGKFYIEGNQSVFDFEFKLNIDKSRLEFFDFMSPEAAEKTR